MQAPLREDRPTLLGAGDPAPVETINADGEAPILLACEHAGREVPEALGRLGMTEDELSRHVAWDIGAEGVSRHLSAALDAPLVLQRYSRLVVDCNRPELASDCMAAVSDGVVVPANRNLDPMARAARWTEIHVPFHAEVAARLDAALLRGPVALVTIHSFTPMLETVRRPRPWHVGVMARRGRHLAEDLMERLVADDPDLVAAFDEPYRINDLGDYTIPVHAEGRGIPHVLIEVRNDLIIMPEGQRAWGDRLARALSSVLPAVLEKDSCRNPI